MLVHPKSAAKSQPQTSSNERENAHNRAGGHARQKCRIANLLGKGSYKIPVQKVSEGQPGEWTSARHGRLACEMAVETLSHYFACSPRKELFT